MAPELVVSRWSECYTLLFHGPESRSSHNEQRYAFVVCTIGYAVGTCEYFGISNWALSLTGLVYLRHKQIPYLGEPFPQPLYERAIAGTS